MCPLRPEKGHDLAGVGLWLAPLQHFAKQPDGDAVGGDFREVAGAQAIPWRPLPGCKGPPNRYVCKQVPWRPQVRESQATCADVPLLASHRFHLPTGTCRRVARDGAWRQIRASPASHLFRSQDRPPTVAPRGRHALKLQPPRGEDGERERRACSHTSSIWARPTAPRPRPSPRF